MHEQGKKVSQWTFWSYMLKVCSHPEMVKLEAPVMQHVIHVATSA